MFYVIYETNAHQIGRTMDYLTWDQCEAVAARLLSCGDIVQFIIKPV